MARHIISDRSFILMNALCMTLFASIVCGHRMAGVIHSFAVACTTLNAMAKVSVIAKLRAIRCTYNVFNNKNGNKFHENVDAAAAAAVAVDDDDDDVVDYGPMKDRNRRVASTSLSVAEITISHYRKIKKSPSRPVESGKQMKAKKCCFHCDSRRLVAHKLRIRDSSTQSIDYLTDLERKTLFDKLISNEPNYTQFHTLAVQIDEIDF